MNYKVGDVITGNVTGIEDYGIFVSFGTCSSGLIHISEISDSFVRNVHDYARLNCPITALIIGVDDNNHYKLSLKSLDVSYKNKNKIIETSTGFTTLSNLLDKWIEDSYAEISKK